MKMSTKAALKAHMSKGAGAHPDPAAKKMAKGGPTPAKPKKFGYMMKQRGGK
jgi:hypothetical protein